MKRLFLLLALAIFLISPLCATAQHRKHPVTDTLNLPNHASRTSILFKNWKGDRVSGHIPDIYDFSSAGYKQGEEGIPEFIGETIINVRDHGAIPNDNQDDTAAIQSAFDAATSYTIVYFPPGKYDVLMTTRSPMVVAPHDHIVVQGAGAQGSENGGTTIRQHQSQQNVSRSGGIFSVRSKRGPTPQTNVRTSSGATPRLVNRYIDVVDASLLIGAKFVIIGGAYTNEEKHFEANIKYITRAQMPSEWTDIQNNLHLNEYHEVDYIDTDNNRVYLKANVANSYGPQHTVKRKNYVEGIGFQDLHFDCGFTKSWDHDKKDDLGYNGRNAIALTNTAHSWAKHIVISNSTSGIEYSGSIHTTIIGIIFKGNTGHYTIVGDGASHVFIALIEDHSRSRDTHGISVQGVTSGIVAWGIGSPDGKLNGPDTHGWQSTNTLYDNYNSLNHQTSGTAVDNRPNHLLGYIRYNNTVSTNHEDFDAWVIPVRVGFDAEGIENAFNHLSNGNIDAIINPTGGFQVIEAIVSGYKTPRAHRDFRFAEGWGGYVNPRSLYVAQLRHRLGYRPAWIEREKREYNLFFNVVFGYANRSTNPITLENTRPTFSEGSEIARSVDENEPVGTEIPPRLSVTDAEHHEFTYTVTDDVGGDRYFEIDNTGMLKTKRVFDHELDAEYTFRVKVRDAGNLSDFADVTVSINDVRENLSPVFTVTGDYVEIRIAEGLPVGSLVGEPVSATDANNDTLTYSLSGTDAAHFTVDADTGQLKTKKVFEFDSAISYYDVLLTATDSDDASVDVSIHVIIKPLNAPIFVNSNVELSVNENRPPGENVGDPITATGADLTYSLSGQDAASFEIDASTGQISANEPLDYENVALYTVTVTASNDSNQTDEIEVSIKVLDERERQKQVQVAIERSLDLLTSLNVRVVKSLYGKLRDEDLERVTDLTIKNHKDLRYLNARDFEGLPNLTHLYIENNSNLSGLGSNLFDGLPKLVELSIVKNDINQLDRLVFGTLHNLEDLYLDDNSLTELDPDIFQSLDNLINLGIRDNELTTLHENLFANLSNVETLGLSGNNLGKDDSQGRSNPLSDNLFRNMENLTVLDLLDNELSNNDIPDEFFKHLPNLYQLRFSGNAERIKFIVMIERVNDNQFKAKIRVGAPTTLVLPLKLRHGEIEGGATTITIEAGETESDTFTVNTTPGSRKDQTTVSFDKFTATKRLPGILHRGYELIKDKSLPIAVFPEPGRSPQAIPDLTRVLPNFPNPFNPETWIPYQLAKPANVSITIFNSRGVVVRELLLGIKPAGFYSNKANAAHWDGRNRIGEYVSSGMYFYQFKTGNKSVIQKMVIMK